METSILSVVWTVIGLSILAVLGFRIATWLVRKILPAEQQAPISVTPRSTGTTALDQRREYLETCGRAGTCAVFGCGANATEKWPMIVQEHSLRDSLVRRFGHKPQDRYRVSLDIGTHDLLCGPHATIAVSLAELELAQRNMAYAEHCRDQAARIVGFHLVDLLDILSAGMKSETARVLQRPNGGPKLASVQQLPAAANGTE